MHADTCQWCDAAEHHHFWAAFARYLGFFQNRCRCGALRFLGGYPDERRNRIVERLNRSWRVR